MSLSQIRLEHLRGLLLSLLQAAGPANDSVLLDASRRLGLQNPTRNQLRNSLFWLEEQALVTLTRQGDLLRAEITPLGEDFQASALHLDGIKRRQD